jgi:diaminohydroxyphosphoribosylaminopyrimidine deaminase/5-amino-6-(5-phosphoribosylamino)uracil reductase
VTTLADEDERFMARALELAARGQGSVEPNPMVGCVLVQGSRIVGEGWHAEFGGPHAEIVALQHARMDAVGATAYVTLEPCSHHGKTPPCTKALLHARAARVVAAMEDPFPPVDGSGIEELKAAGVECSLGTLRDQAQRLNAPYLKRLLTGRPWVIAKWAMTRDGMLALADGSRWISNERSRAVVQQLRGRVDAIVVGSGTARLDDPLLTARPADPNDVRRTAVRVVVDSAASLALKSRLVRTAADVPVLVAVAADASVDKCRQLAAAGVDVFPCAGATHAARFESLLDELGRRRMTNVLVEGGSRLLRALCDADLFDELHVFTAPKNAGDKTIAAPRGVLERLVDPVTTNLDGDQYVHGRVRH